MRQETLFAVICILAFGAGVFLTLTTAPEKIKTVEKIVSSQCPAVTIPQCPSLSCARVECPALVQPECQTLDYDKCVDIVKKARRIK